MEMKTKILEWPTQYLEVHMRTPKNGSELRVLKGEWKTCPTGHRTVLATGNIGKRL